MKKPMCRTFCGRYYGWISLGTNLFNTLFQISVGILTGSQALIADGVHSLSDGLSSLITVFVLKVSEKPADEDHPHGHGKIEFLASGLFGSVLVFLALLITIRAIITLYSGTAEAPSFLALGPALLSTLINLVISSYGYCVGREINSPVITAVAKENFADALTSFASVIGIFMAVIGYPAFDPIAAIAVALCIAYMGYELIQEALGGLMDTAISPEQRKQMREVALSVPGFRSIRALKTKRLGQKIWLDVQITADPQLTLAEADRVSVEVRNALLRNFPDLQEAAVYLTSEPVRKNTGKIRAVTQFIGSLTARSISVLRRGRKIVRNLRTKA